MSSHANLLFLLLFIFVSISSLGAQPVISGKIVDEANAPLPYVTIYIEGQNCGSLSEEDGTFSFTCANVSLDTATLVAQYLGFQTKRVTLSKTDGELTIILIEDGVTLNAVEVSAEKVKPKKFKFRKKGPDFYYQENVSTNYMLAVKIPNSPKHEGVLTEVSFYVGEAASNKIPMRLSFYRIDETCNCPGETLHSQNVFAGVTSGINSIDLREDDVKLPPSSFFVAFELLPTPGRKSNKLDYSLGMINTVNSLEMYEQRGGLGWKLLDGLDRQGLLVEIDYLKL